MAAMATIFFGGQRFFSILLSMPTCDRLLDSATLCLLADRSMTHCHTVDDVSF